MNTELWRLSATELAARIARRDATARAATSGPSRLRGATMKPTRSDGNSTFE